MACFILVPGALHCPTHFGQLASLLRQGGVNEAVAVELPGLVSESADPLRATFEAHVSAVVAAVDAQPRSVVLVGHSTAGCAITAAGEQRSTRIDKLVFLAAEALPGPPSFALEPASEGIRDGVFCFQSEGRLMAVAQGKAERAAELLFSGADDQDYRNAAGLLRATPTLPDDPLGALVLSSFWKVPKAYIRCTGDRVMLPAHQDVMHSRLGDGALRFDLESGHAPFVSACAELAALLLSVSAMPAVQFRPLRKLCDATWEDTETRAARIEGAALAYRISKSRRDSTLAKVLKFPAGVAVGAPAWYWYESFVDDPTQYTNAKLTNVPERGHEPPLDLAGISRSLCAEGVVVYAECSHVGFSWKRVATKIPGSQPWTRVAEVAQVWGIDGREWNGSYAGSEPGTFVEHLGKYARGSADAFWEDVPRKAMDLLAGGD